MHRADPHASRPSPRRRGRRNPLPVRGGPAAYSSAPAGPGPRALDPTPRPGHHPRKPPRPAPPGTWIGTYRIHPLDVITVLLGIAVLLAIFWPRRPHARL